MLVEHIAPLGTLQKLLQILSKQAVADTGFSHTAC